MKENKPKRLLSLLLILALVMGMLPLTALPVYAAQATQIQVWDGTAFKTYTLATDTDLPTGLSWNSEANRLELDGYNGGRIEQATSGDELTFYVLNDSTIDGGEGNALKYSNPIIDGTAGKTLTLTGTKSSVMNITGNCTIKNITVKVQVTNTSHDVITAGTLGNVDVKQGGRLEVTVDKEYSSTDPNKNTKGVTNLKLYDNGSAIIKVTANESADAYGVAELYLYGTGTCTISVTNSTGGSKAVQYQPTVNTAYNVAGAWDSGNVNYTAVAAENNANLDNLSVDKGGITPLFNFNVISYTATDYQYAYSTAKIKATVEVEGATLKINGEAATSGVDKEVPLAVGDNEILIEVTAKDGVTTKTYSLTIKRLSGGSHALTVVNGTKLPNTETVEAGTTVTITSNTPAPGKVFDRWTSPNVTLTDPNSATTTFTMPTKDVTVTATYRDVYNITVNDGSADKTTASQGETVTITADPAPAGKVFHRWVSEGTYYAIFANATSATTTFTMPAGDVTVRATYQDAYSITVNNGTSSKDVAGYGEQITIEANTPASGYVFDKWTSDDGVTFADASKATTTFYMPSKLVTVTANYKSEDAVTELFNIKVNISKPSTTWEQPALDPVYNKATSTYDLNVSTEYNTIYFELSHMDSGQAVTATVDGNPLGVTSGWYGFSTDQYSLTQAKTVFVFTVTAKDTTTTGTYTVTVNRGSGTTYPVTVNGGTATTTNPAEGDTVTITADTPASGKVFDNWTSTDGVTFADANSSTTTFVMPDKSVTVTANYKNDPDKDTELKDIKVKIYKDSWVDLPLTPTYNKATRGYSLNVGFDYTTIYFYLGEMVSGQAVTATVDGTPLTVNKAANGFNTANHTFTQAQTVFVFTVTAKDTTTTGTYTVTVNRGSGTTYPVTVNGGTTTTSNPAEGDTVTITADTPASGKVFDNWTCTDGVTFADANSSTTTFVMPNKSVTVTANYKIDPEKDTELDNISVNIWKEGLGWEGGTLDPAYDKAIRAYDLNVGTDYSAIYFYLGEIVSGQDVTATVDGETLAVTTATNGFNTANHTFTKAQTVFVFTVTAKDTTTTGTYTVTVNRGSGTTYPVTVNGGTTTTPTPAEGDTVTIMANDPATDKVFDKWTSTDGVTFADANSATTTFEMPDKAVTVTANYKNDPEKDTELKNIQVQIHKGSWVDVPLTPEYNKETRSYSLNMSTDYQSIIFHPYSMVPNKGDPVTEYGQKVTATVDGDNLVLDTTFFGFSSKSYNVTKDKTVFVFTVTSKGSSKTGDYTITVNRGTTYTITYDSNGGTGTMTNGTASTGTAFTLPANGFTPPAGKQFKAWDINGVEYAPGATYTFTADTSVKAVWEDILVTSIAVKSTSHKTAYKVGDTLDVTDLTIEATMSDSTKQTINVTSDMVTGFDSSGVSASQTLTITYDGKTTTYDISIGKADGPAAPTGLAGVKPTTLGGSDGKITGTTSLMEYADNSSFISPTACTDTETTGLSAGTYYIRVKETATHEAGASVEITVPAGSAATVASIAVNSTTHKTAYKVGDTLDITDLTIEANMSDSTKQTINVTSDMVTGFDSSGVTASQTLTISYGGKTTSYNISIDKADGPGAPTGLVGVKPTTLGGSDGRITGTSSSMEYASDSSFTSPTDCTNTETTGLSAGTYYVRVKETATHKAGASVEITVPAGSAATVANIAVNSTSHKTAYKVGETLDVSNLTIEATMSDSSTQTINVTLGMVTGFDSSAVSANQTLTITYDGKTTSYDISIAKADGPAAPTGLVGVKPTTAGGSDGKITGTTNLMEYATDSSFSSPTDCNNTETTGLSAGTYYVRIKETATHKAGAYATVTVPDGTTVAVTGVTLNKGTLSLTVGGEETLTATVAPTEASNQNVTWSSSDDTIATVDTNGKVTAVAAGTATITATTEDGSYTATCDVTVTPATVTITGVTVSPSSTSVEKGGTQTFTAIVSGTGDYDKTVTWSVYGGVTGTTIDYSGILTVDIAETAETLTVTAESNGDSSKKGTATVTITDTAVIKYTLTVNNGSGSGEYAVGDTVNIYAGNRSGYTFTGWTSSDVTITNASNKNVSFTMPAKAVTVTANWTYNDRDRDRDRDSRSSDSGGSRVQPTIPVADGTIQANYTAPGGTAALALPDAKVDEIIAKSKDGEAVLDLSKVSGVTAAELPKTAVSAMNEAGLGVTVKLPAGSITLNKDAAASVAGQAEGSRLKLELKQVAPASLTGKQKEAVKSSDLVLDINISSGTKKISSFDGTLSVMVSYNGPQPVAVWYLNDKGDLERFSCTFKDGAVSFDLDHLSLYVVGQDTEEPAWVNPFTDVKEADWFYDAVNYINKAGLMAGTSETAFSPYTDTTRGMIVTILHRLEGKPKANTANDFKDVGADKYYTDAVAWASDNRIVSGYGNGIFGSENSITREQLAVILMNYAQYKGYDVSIRADISKFADGESISTWAKEAMSWANAEGLIQGSGNQLMPTGNAQRSQVAAILQRFIETIAK